MTIQKRSQGKPGSKIGEVVEQTGVSRELIHHYLRLGLLPPSTTRARYDEHQVKLLLLIKQLRDQHNLPLELMRSVFTYFDFDTDKLEPLVLADPLSHRLTRLVQGNQQEDWFCQPLSAERLLQITGVGQTQLDRYVELGVVTPGADGDFSSFDSNVISLCQCGIAEGLPLESFRTIASYVRLGFQLEHDDLFSMHWEGQVDVQSLMSRLFLRREIVASFVHNVLQALVQTHLRQLLQEGAAGPRRAALDAVIYRPSPNFVQRHKLLELIEQRRHELSNGGDTLQAWQRLAELNLHAGQSREAAFVLEQALRRWPGDPQLGQLHGLALALSGETQKGRERLEQVVQDSKEASARARVYLALVLFCRAPDEPPPAVELLTRIHELVTGALEADSAEPAADLEVPVLAGWMLCALPGAFADAARGRDLLVAAHDVLVRPSGDDEDQGGLPGIRLRRLINVAYLLWDAVQRAGVAQGRQAAGARMLQATICSLDPGCSFASRVYMEGS